MTASSDLSTLADVAPLFLVSGKRLDQKVLTRIRKIERRTGLAVLITTGNGVGQKHKVDLESLRSAAPELFVRHLAPEDPLHDRALSDLEKREKQLLESLREQVDVQVEAAIEAHLEAHERRLFELQERDDAIGKAFAVLRNELGLAKALIVSMRVRLQAVEAKLAECSRARA